METGTDIKVSLSYLLKLANIDPEKVSVRVDIDCGANFSFPNRPGEGYPGFGVSFPGYGEFTSGCETDIIWVEYPNGNGRNHPEVSVWTDINSDEGVTIRLDNALLSLLKQDTNCN